MQSLREFYTTDLDDHLSRLRQGGYVPEEVVNGLTDLLKIVRRVERSAKGLADGESVTFREFAADMQATNELRTAVEFVSEALEKIDP